MSNLKVEDDKLIISINLLLSWYNLSDLSVLIPQVIKPGVKTVSKIKLFMYNFGNDRKHYKQLLEAFGGVLDEEELMTDKQYHEMYDDYEYEPWEDEICESSEEYNNKFRYIGYLPVGTNMKVEYIPDRCLQCTCNDSVIYLFDQERDKGLELQFNLTPDGLRLMKLVDKINQDYPDMPFSTKVTEAYKKLLEAAEIYNFTVDLRYKSDRDRRLERMKARLEQHNKPQT